MKRLALGLLMVVVAAACSEKKSIKIVDSGNGVDTGSNAAACNVLQQSGCNPGEKCTWVRDVITPNIIGHIGCVPDGTKAEGEMCMYGPPGSQGFDDCVKGTVCQQAKDFPGGRCKQICGTADVAPLCGTGFACARYSSLFANPGEQAEAGVCDKLCDPLANNDFDGSGGSGQPTGTDCPDDQFGTQIQYIGCYGIPTGARVSRYTCTRQPTNSGDLVHRSICTTANGCQNASGQSFLNGCAQGYLPMVNEQFGSMAVACVAICKPGNSYMGATTQLPDGVAPHRCRNPERRSVQPFKTATATMNGEHCTFSWWWEFDMMNMFVRSPYSDLVGICIDHTMYKYDSNFSGMVESTDANFPACGTLPMLGTGAGSAHVWGADDFGCIDTTLAQPFAKKPATDILVQKPRMLFHEINN